MARYRGGLTAREDVLRQNPGKDAGAQKTVAALAQEITKTAELLKTIAEG